MRWGGISEYNYIVRWHATTLPKPGTGGVTWSHCTLPPAACSARQCAMRNAMRREAGLLSKLLCRLAVVCAFVPYCPSASASAPSTKLPATSGPAPSCFRAQGQGSRLKDRERREIAQWIRN
jgi:hypothetical protein